jgi:hypothetical protein
MNAMNEAGPISFIAGTGTVAQIVLSLTICTTLYIVLMSAEMLYKSVVQVTSTRVDLMPMTVNSQDKSYEFEQNPQVVNSKLLPLSDNERSGAEFSYAFFLWVDPGSFKQEEGLLHIFHKGYSVPYPLLGPGVFMHSNTNTLRVYMNSSTTWNNYIDIENIPVKKWVHCVVMARDNTLEVYINGNLIKKLNVNGGTLYQNFGNLYMFSQRSLVLNPVQIPSLEDKPLHIFGTYSGNLSNLFYFSYALSYTEIQALVAQGPSSKTVKNTQDTPPYLQDTWWVNDYSS